MALLGLVSACADRPRPAPVSERAQPVQARAKPARAPGKSISTPIPSGLGVYRVRKGDTLFKIAFEHDLDYQALARLNTLAYPYRIYAGQRLRVPEAPSPVSTRAVPDTTVSVEARALPASVKGLRAEAPDESPSRATQTWVWPAQGQVVTEFEPAGGRKGLDIAGKRDAPVKAAASGTVVYAGSALRGYGKLAIVQHSPTLLSAYAHQSVLRVAEGQKVSVGEVIGAMGDSDTDRVKLHFEVREFGKPVDPRLFLPR